MALDNSLICDTSATDDEIRRLLVRYGATITEAEAGVLRYVAPGTIGTVLPASDLTKELMAEVFGFNPSVRFLFRLDKFDGFDEGLNTFTTISTAVIRELANDCVLLIGEDEPVLVRRDKKMTLERSDDARQRTLLTAIAEGVGDPYEFGDIPDL